MVIASLLIAATFPIGAEVTQELDPRVVTFFRFMLAAVVLGGVVVAKYQWRWPNARELGCYAVISITIALFFIMMFWALRYTTALNTATIFTLVPGLSAIYAAMALGERLGRARMAALGICTIGALWVIFRGDVDRLLALEINSGDALFFLGCLSMALYTPCMRQFHTGRPPIEVTFWVVSTAILWVLPFAILPMWHIRWASISAGTFLGVAYLGVMATALTFFIYQICTAKLGPTRVITYTFTVPVLVIVIDLVSGRGPPPVTVLPGVALVLAAIVVMQWGKIGAARSAGLKVKEAVPSARRE